jgi:cell division protein FtsB
LYQDGKLLQNNAREQLGMIGPDEVLYRVSPAST